MKKLQLHSFLFLMILFIGSCSEEPIFKKAPFVVAFKETSSKLVEIKKEKEIHLIYSEPAQEEGIIRVKITTKNAVYGTDFITSPQAVGNEIVLPVSRSENKNSFKISRANNPFAYEMEIQFTITSIEIENSKIQGNVSYKLSDKYLGGSFSPTVGGPNEPNQVFIDLSNNKETIAKRDSWDLAFYGGDNFRVAINGSLYMATKALNTTDISNVNSSNTASLQPDVAVGTFKPSNTKYVDNPDGDILKTAIAEVSEDNAKNKVYLLNLGYQVGTITPKIGSVAIAGKHRGWKKIRILKEGNNYKLQYANLDDANYKEVLISKNNDFNFTHFSFNTNNIVSVAPEKKQWDICFTVFTNTLGRSGSYGFSDFIIHNRKGGVKSYKLKNHSVSYTDFGLADIDNGLLKENQTVIGSSWRNVFSKTVNGANYYILKDASNNYYKIKFLDLVGKNGERGYPKFEYKLLE